jgi:hypothetical protein
LFNRASIKDLMAMKIATYLPCEEVLTAGFEAKPRRPAHPIDCSGCGLRIRGAKIVKGLRSSIKSQPEKGLRQLDHFLVWRSEGIAST